MTNTAAPQKSSATQSRSANYTWPWTATRRINEMNLEQIRDQLSAADKLIVSVMLTPPEIRRWLDVINVAIKDAALLDEFIHACRKSWGAASESEGL